MNAGSGKKTLRDGFHRELVKQVKSVQREFDKVERLVKSANQMENVSEEIQHLQEMKDRKISLLRVRFYHEANLIVKEFKDKVQDVLDNDVRGGGGERTSPARRTSRRHQVGNDDAHKTGMDSDAEQAANVEHSRLFLEKQKAKNSKTKDSMTDSDSPGKKSVGAKPDTGKERKLGSIILKVPRPPAAFGSTGASGTGAGSNNPQEKNGGDESDKGSLEKPPAKTNPTRRTTGRRGGKQADNNEAEKKELHSDGEQAATVEHSRKILEKQKAKEIEIKELTTDSDCGGIKGDGAETEMGQEKKLGKNILNAPRVVATRTARGGGVGLNTTAQNDSGQDRENGQEEKEAQGQSENGAGPSNVTQEAGASKPAQEVSQATDGSRTRDARGKVDEVTPAKAVRRSTRDRKQTPKAKDSSRVTRSRR